MKKIIFIFAALLMTALCANAQTATENAKFFDNWSAGIGAGATTPLDFNPVFPVNAGAKLFINKDLTPVVGLQAEAGVLFNDNNFGRWTSTTVKLTNVGLNGTVNLNNLFAGYNGTPRVFEVSTNTGLGWLHYWNGGGANDLTTKTGLDLSLNLGKTRASSIVLSPAVYWNITGGGAKVQFNKHRAQLALTLSYVYHFGTSNGTRHFKTYDVGAMISEISRLNDELAQKPTEVIVEKIVYQQAPVTDAVVVSDPAPLYVFFAQDSAELTDDAKAALDTVDGVVEIIGSASIEGTKEYNQRLSEKRAAVVTDYLTKRNIDVKSYEGIGARDNTSPRIAVVKIVQ